MKFYIKKHDGRFKLFYKLKGDKLPRYIVYDYSYNKVKKLRIFYENMYKDYPGLEDV